MWATWPASWSVEGWQFESEYQPNTKKFNGYRFNFTEAFFKHFL